ncbi:MAG TPA: glycosyltransferase [Streptosporangiaceae bacterium]|nr:glycosyltransferase [Streptosporangiaceae bacterium]
MSQAAGTGPGPGSVADTLSVSCVIITMGTRPDELTRAIESTEPLRADGVELVLVGNGAELPPVPGDVKTVLLPENLGVAGGRNAGVEASSGDLVMFLDDDGWFSDPGIAKHVAGRFAADPRLAVLAFRVVDPTGGTGVRWHVPRLRAGDPDRSSPVTTFVGAGFAARRSAYREAGGLPELFFFAHEETDLAWQLIERGYTLEYDADARMCHPPVSNKRHDIWYRYDGRNRVLLARRNLPWPLAFVYLLDWTALTIVRERRLPGALKTWFAGFAEGWRTDPGQRRPISMRAVWRMTRAGRPPVI